MAGAMERERERRGESSVTDGRRSRRQRAKEREGARGGGGHVGLVMTRDGMDGVGLTGVWFMV